MAGVMTDPMNALKSFQEVLAAGGISPERGRLHSDLLVLLDHPNGAPRFTYALIDGGSVIALATFAPADPMEGSPCFNVGYAVDESHRSRGRGKQVVRKAFDELTSGFKNAGVPHLYVEAIVSASNEASKKVASEVFSNSPTPCTDSVSGQPALQYVRQLF